jgi:hypothetical protein
VEKVNKDKLLIELQSKFRKNIKTTGLIYMGLYDLIKAEQPITPEGLSKAIFAPVAFVLEYEYIYSEYT